MVLCIKNHLFIVQVQSEQFFTRVMCNVTVISEEHPVSGGGAEFPEHVLMSVTVRVRVNLF